MNLFAPTIISLSCLIAYLMGSIPFGLILGKAFGKGDIRKIGSGNIGATNMLRTGSKKLAALTLFLDFSKGLIGVAMAQGFCNHFFTTQSGDFVITPNVLYLAGVAAVIGHVFPVWLKFKGGKGVATTLGVFYATQPLIGMITTFGWLLIFYLTRVSSLAAIGSIVCAPILGYRYAPPGEGRDFAAMALILAIIVVAKHKDNIDRLRTGGEDTWKKKDDPS